MVSAALKGGVGKTTTAVYLAAVAVSNRHPVYLIDADPQASSADWIESSEDERLQKVNVVEAPTDRLLVKALDRVSSGDVALVDTPPGHERLLAKALERANVVIVPTRVGGVETSRATAALDIVPAGTPAGLVISSARTFTPRLPRCARRLGGGGRAGLGHGAGAGGHRRRSRRVVGGGWASMPTAASGAGRLRAARS